MPHVNASKYKKCRITSIGLEVVVHVDNVDNAQHPFMARALNEIEYLTTIKQLIKSHTYTTLHGHRGGGRANIVTNQCGKTKSFCIKFQDNAKMPALFNFIQYFSESGN